MENYFITPITRYGIYDRLQHYEYQVTVNSGFS